MQREVADRLAAAPGDDDYGALTAGVRLVATVERLFGVKAGAFRPPPRVESAVVRITPLVRPLVRGDDDEAAAKWMIQSLFQRRRQQVQRSLREASGLEAAAVLALLEMVGIAPQTRPEQLSAAQFVALARLARPA